MRLNIIVAGLAAGLVAAVSPAAAGWEEHDRVHADSFGNLVVVAPGGYKRIVVGQGHLAKELRGYTGGALDEEGAPIAPVEDERADADRPCPAILVKGRSYMYGFDEGVIPLFGDRCG